ncbi:hypothetical protein [Novispirillum itersonii]|uniref:Uncharacterized protein n=1 Tax=Novispirillum itersonii TaxID=189 RepID=A0A7X0DND9_NOVIT|nr:hypothetical protein [Novispirillum itersonii]MBB6212043.1 hypothetical protein [Novispirillum itersonii]
MAQHNEDDIPQRQLTDDRPFNPFRAPKTVQAQTIVADVLGQLQCFERVKGLRQRQRKPTDQQTLETTVAAVVCDLIHRFITKPDGWVSVSLSNQDLGRASRYRATAMNKTLPTVIKRLAEPEMAFVEMEIGHQGYFGPARRTVMKAGSRLLTRLHDHGIGLDDLTQSTGQEVIILKDSKADYWDEGGLVEYDDTDQTRHYRDEVQAINAWLTQADIQFDGDPVVDDTDRLLRRYFSRGSFDCGGRLFGGFWQPLPKWQRHKGLLIDGEEVATLDYGQMAPRILYGLTGVPAPTTDSYLLPGLEAQRKGVKKVMNALLFADKPLTRFPADTRKLFPTRMAFAQVVEALQQLHAPINHLFFTGIGHQVQFVESEILVDVLLALKTEGIIGLPVHDAVIVARSSIPQVSKIMLEVFKDYTGVEGMVSEERG